MEFVQIWGLPVVKISAQSDIVLFPQTHQNGSNRVMSQKDSCIFWVKLTKANSQKLKLGIQKVWMEGPIISYVRISDDPLAQSYGGNLDPICAPNIFYLILQWFYDFSRTWGLRYVYVLLGCLLSKFQQDRKTFEGIWAKKPKTSHFMDAELIQEPSKIFDFTTTYVILMKLTDIYLNKVFHLEKSWGVIYRVWDGANKKNSQNEPKNDHLLILQ